jgi:hypothetical protein
LISPTSIWFARVFIETLLEILKTMSQKISRRNLLKIGLLFSGGAAIVLARQIVKTAPQADMAEGLSTGTTTLFPVDEKAQSPAYTPSRTPPPPGTTPAPTRTLSPAGSKPGVVVTHSNSATNFTTGYFWQHVNRTLIDSMVDRGVLTLTGKSTLEDAWRTILNGYTPGHKVAIKVSFNNSESGCQFESNKIDAVVEPVLAVIRGLRAMRVPEQDIFVYDSIRAIPTRFITPLRQEYPAVQIFDGGNGCSPQDPASSQNFIFTTPDGPGITPHPISQTLVNAAHLINIPIMKTHGMAGYSLGLKNHYGSTTITPKKLHNYSALASPDYSDRYNSTVDLNTNPNIRDKTRLTLADGLFSAYGNTKPPTTWKSFGGNYPNSLFFSFDATAIDCVMADYLDYELVQRGSEINPKAGDYLPLAEQAGLGAFERGNPWTGAYTKINFSKVEI